VPRVVVALGGNALLRRGEEDTAETMRRSARYAAEPSQASRRPDGRSW